jgi:hypothetical protein
MVGLMSLAESETATELKLVLQLSSERASMFDAMIASFLLECAMRHHKARCEMRFCWLFIIVD